MKRSTWHGYPMDPGAHPTRPWWRKVTSDVGGMPGLVFDPLSYWLRSDGHDLRFVDTELEASPAGALATQPLRDRWLDATAGGPLEAPSAEELMNAIDRWWPLPTPPPMAGQVWVYPGIGMSCAINWVRPRGEDCWQVQGLPRPTGLPDEIRRFGAGGEVWPPRRGAVLVAGPLAPWAPKHCNNGHSYAPATYHNKGVACERCDHVMGTEECGHRHGRYGCTTDRCRYGEG